ncbi:MAG: tetratricopeptide repeat protein [Paraprevotella sp.]|nr:tetratricopeptide repeat protein [Paraprevotella sp.]
MTKKKQTAPVNEIDETIVASAGFVERNIKALSYTVGGILAVVIVALLTYQYYIVPRNAEAADNIAVAEQLFLTGDYEKALNGDGTNDGFLMIIDKYGSTPSGNLARLYAGLCYAHTDKAEEAVKYLEDYDACDDMMVSNAALGALGNCYAQLNQNDKAASTLLKAAKRADNNTLSPLYYLQAGQIYEALGNKDKALDCYETIKSDYPQSVQSQDIDKYIERLK